MKKRLLPNPYTLWPALRKESSPTNAPSTRSRGGLTQLLLPFSLFLTLSVYAKSSIPNFSTATDNLCLNNESTTGISGGALHFDVVDDHVATCTSTTLADDDVVTCEVTSNDPCADPTLAVNDGIMMEVSAASIPGAALHFDGVDDHVVTTLNGPSGNSARTVEAWVKTTSTAGGTILDYGVASPNGTRFGFFVQGNGRLSFIVGGGSANTTFTTVNNGNWHHVALTFDPEDNNTVRFYFDGALFYSIVAQVVPNTTSNPILIGKPIFFSPAFSYDNYFDGSIDEVRIWNRALSECEIQNNYTCELFDPTNQTGLLAYYQSNQGVAEADNTGEITLADASGNSQTGTLTNFDLSGATSNWITPGGVASGGMCSEFILPVSAISIAADPGNNITPGTSVTFTATPTNGGSTPAYQWKVNGTNVGTDQATYTSTTLEDGDVVTCEMTSNDPCADPTMATSNEVTMAVSTGVNGPVCTDYTTYTTANGLNNNFIGNRNGIFVDGSNVYVCTGNNLNISNNGGTTFSVKTTSDGLASSNVFSVYASGSTVFAATGAGLSQSTDGGNTFTTNTSLGNVSTYSIAVSGSNVYVTTPNGVAISTDNGVTFTTTNIGFVSSIAVSGATVVAGDLGNGLYISTDGGSSFTNLTTADGLATNVVNSVAVVGGAIYLALGDEIDFLTFNTTPGGVDIITDNGTTITHKTTADGLGSSDVFGIQVLGTTVYAATRGGLSISTDGGSSFTNYTTSNTTGFGANYVQTVYVTSDKIYAGTEAGLSVCEACTPVTPSVAIAADPGNSITPGTSVTFTATPTNGGSTPAYQWKVNGTNVGTDQATYTSTTLEDGDVVTCEMTSNDPCADPATAMSNEITMEVIPPCEGVTNRIYVTTTGTGNGSSWANATSDLQAAIDNTCGVTEIWMAAGTYKPADYPTDCTGCSSPRDYAFVLSSGVKVYGGFAGTETALIERTPGNETILSGDIDNDNTLNDGNTHHVVLSINNNDQTLLEGCTVTGGYSPDEGSASITIESEEIYSYDAGGLVAKNSNALFTNNKFVNNLGYHGGGAYVDRGSARFENCRFEDNRSDGGYGIGLYTYDAAVMIDNCHFENNNDDDAYGGGCYLEDGTVDLKNSTFVNNSAYEGGGLYTDDASLTVDSCVFDGNSAYNKGGGYYLVYGRGTVKNCTFVNNTADDGGGLVLDEDSSDLTIENCTFTGNTAEDGIGGAMYLYYPSYKARTVVSNCIFTDNSAGDGGAVYLDSPSYTAVTSFTDCQFINNTGEDGGAIGYESIYEYGLEIERCSFLDNNALYGGAISGAGGDNELLAISNSLFAKNTAQGDEDYPGGGAVYIYEVTEATLTNCTFADNTSVTSAGGGVVNDDSGLTMENCIFWGNTGGQGTLNDQQFFNLSGATANIAHSLFESGLPTGVTNGGNNIYLDPLFTDATNDDYTLDGCSPAINAGDNTDVAATDLVGATRIQDGNVDMGAYENTLIEGRVVSISIDNISEAECNNTTCTTDDTYTADVTVTYSEKPASGTLSLNGPNVISSEVVNVSGTDATSYTFIGVEMLADGGDIDLTATFSEGCSYSDDEIGTAPECSVEFIPSDITVSGFGCFGPNGTYAYIGMPNGAPVWESANGFFIMWDGASSEWLIGGVGQVWSSNPNGSVDNLPCTTGWTDPQGCALSSGSIALSGGCGNLSGGSGPACDITDISLDNTSGCDDNGTIDDTDDYFTTDITVTFAYAPTDGTLTLKLGNTTLATTEADLTCSTTYTFTGVQLPSDGNDVILTAGFSSDCSFTSATLITAPEPCSCVPTSDFTACPG